MPELANNKNFYFYVTLRGLTAVPASAFIIYILWVSLNITKSSVISGIIDSISMIPFFGAPIFGTLLDTSGKKKLFGVVGLCLAVMSILIVPYTYVSSALIVKVSLLILATLLFSSSREILGSLYNVLSKSLLKKSQYRAGVSLENTVANVSRLIGQTFLGITLIYSLFLTTTFLALFEIVAIIFLILIYTPIQQNKEIPRLKFIKEIRRGYNFVKKSKVVKGIIMTSVLTNLFVGMLDLIIVYLVEIKLSLSALFLSGILVSLLSGTIIGTTISKKFSQNSFKIMGVGLVLAGTDLLFIYFTVSYLYLLIIFIIFGIISGFIENAGSNLMLDEVDLEVFSRASGFVSASSSGAIFFSSIIAGYVIFYFHYSSAILMIFIALIVVGALTFRFSRFVKG